MLYAIAKECESHYVKVCELLSANDREYALGFSRARLDWSENERAAATARRFWIRLSVRNCRSSRALVCFDAGFGLLIDCIRLPKNSSKHAQNSLDTKTTQSYRSKNMNIFHKGNSDLTNAIVREDWVAVKAECEAHPKNAAVWSTRVGFDGEHESHVLPIHSAAALCAPKDAIEALALANPDGVKAKETSFKRLPLHIACQSHAPADMVATLLSFYPQGAADTDVLGRLPLHYAW